MLQGVAPYRHMAYYLLPNSNGSHDYHNKNSGTNYNSGRENATYTSPSGRTVSCLFHQV